MTHLATREQVTRLLGGPIATLIAALLLAAAVPLTSAQPTLDTGLVETALLPDGFVGADNGAGTGFVYDGDPGLFEGQFLVGLGPDTVIGQPYSSADGAPPAEWTSTSGVTEIPTPFGFDQAIEAAFAAVSGEVAVTVRAYAADGAAYVVLEYEVANTSGGPLDAVYLGLFADWDVGDFAQNRGSFIEPNGLLFVFDESEVSTNVFGTIVLNPAPVSGFSLSAETDDAGLYSALTVRPTDPPAPAADRRTVVGVGPYALGMGERVVARFALAGESSRGDLSTSAGLVQEIAEGTVLEESIEVNGLAREYQLFVPFGYDGTESLPLVLNYHAFGSSPENQNVLHTEMYQVAKEHNFLVINPAGLTVYDPAVFDEENPGWVVPGTFEGASAQDDVAFTKTLIDTISQDYRVDPERIHAAGWSNGGVFSFLLACVLPTRIASVASVAGQMGEVLLETCTTDQRVSTMQIHGTADPILPFEGIPDFYPAADASSAFWAAQNGCDSTPMETALPDLDPDDSSTVTRLDYGGCTDTEVVFYRIDGGGHAWPGTGPEDPDFFGPTNRDIEGSREIWAFFEENPLVVSNDDEAPLPTHAALRAAYPNPVTSATTLGFALPAPERVRLEVYDVLGRRVAVVLDEVRPAGPHEVHFDAAELASGPYLARLQTGTASLTQRFVVVR